MTNDQINIPDMMLLIAPGCPHCPAAVKNSSNLLKEGVIGRLEVINIAIHPDVAEAVGTRSVPWMRIGQIELSGLHSLAEMKEWAGRAARKNDPRYISYLLETNRLNDALDLLREDAAALGDTIKMIANIDTPFSTRIGIGAIIEDLAGSDTLEACRDILLSLTEVQEKQVKSDATHYLGFTQGDNAVITSLEALAQLQDEEISEIATDSLLQLRHT